jgi:hypothetical protein
MFAFVIFPDSDALSLSIMMSRTAFVAVLWHCVRPLREHDGLAILRFIRNHFSDSAIVQ